MSLTQIFNQSREAPISTHIFKCHLLPLKFTTTPLMKRLLKFMFRFDFAHWSAPYQMKLLLKFRLTPTQTLYPKHFPTPSN